MRTFFITLLIFIATITGTPEAVSAEDSRIPGEEAVTRGVVRTDWGKTFYEDLWKSTCDTNPDIHFVIQKLDDQGKGYAARWLADLASPDAPHNYRVYPNPEWDFESEPQQYCKLDAKNAKKQPLSKQDFLALRLMVIKVRDRLEKAYEQYFLPDDQTIKLARAELIELAGTAAVARLDRQIATELTNVIPHGLGRKQRSNSLDNFLKGDSDKYNGFDARHNF